MSAVKYPWAVGLGITVVGMAVGATVGEIFTPMRRRTPYIGDSPESQIGGALGAIIGGAISTSWAAKEFSTQQVGTAGTMYLGSNGGFP